MIVNGIEKNFPSETTIREIIKAIGFFENVVVVKVDGERIPKECYNKSIDKDSCIEIFSIISGG